MELRILMRTLSILSVLVLFTACTKEIEVDLPKAERKFVIEGTIEQGRPPMVIITRTQGFFEPTDLSTFANIFVDNAQVFVNDGNGEVELDRLCSSQIPPELIDEAAAMSGLDPALLIAANICIYTKFDNTLNGIVGGTYNLRVVVEDQILTSTTHIPAPVPIDSLWFKLAESDGSDTINGYIWARFNDPDTMGNNYRVQTRRTNQDFQGRDKDPTFVSPIGSVTNDDFINGLTVDFIIFRGNSAFETDPADEGNFSFARNDTVIVRMLSIGSAEFEFYRTFESNVATQGDIFTTPTNVISNINGGLGIWAGLGVDSATVICVP